MPEVFCAWLKCLRTMERDDWNDLLHWKKSESRKPLIIRGARQVGKTWLMKEFGRTEYDQYAYVHFESNSVLRNLFKENFDIHRVITAIQIETGLTINAANILIILDEIQEAQIERPSCRERVCQYV